MWVHANVDRVELFVNGRSRGTKDVVPNRHLEWTIPYEPGVIEARGWKDGKPLRPVRRETAGASKRIELTADRTRLCADGQDVAMLTARILDAHGREVPRANDLITFAVEGQGRIIGVGNGDPNSHEPDRATSRRAFNGLAQAILQTTQEGGGITVMATSPGLKSGFVRLRAV